MHYKTEFRFSWSSSTASVGNSTLVTGAAADAFCAVNNMLLLLFLLIHLMLLVLVLLLLFLHLSQNDVLLLFSFLPDFTVSDVFDVH